MKPVIGGAVGFVLMALFIWLFGAFIAWDIAWPQTIPDWNDGKRFFLPLIWIWALGTSVLIGNLFK